MKIDTATGRPGMRGAAALVLAAWLCGCAATVAPPPAAVEPAVAVADPPPAAGWWYARFRIAWPPGAPPAWHVDGLLADRVLRPLLEARGRELPLWRFHRRAAPDAGGHLFSFVYYAPRRVAAAVKARIERDDLVTRLRAEGHLEGLLLDDPAGSLHRDLAHTSDAGWPPDLQRSWPWFAMGVSAHWLRLLGEVQAGDPPLADAGTGSLLARYAAINARVDALWREQGQHAYLHHLNALFGYQPMLLRELRRF